MLALRDEVFDSQEVDDEENNIPGAGSTNDINIQKVNDDEKDNKAYVDEEADEGEEDDDLLHVPSRKRELISSAKSAPSPGASYIICCKKHNS